MAEIKSANTTQAKVNKKHHKLLIALAIVFCIIFVMPLLVLGWLGFIPGLSNMMGSRNPKDLGVHYTPADYTSYQQKTNFSFKEYSLAPASPKNPEEKEVLAQPITTNKTVITEAELTSALNSLNLPWLPARNIQAKINQGNIEISALLDSSNLNNLTDYLKENGASSTDAENTINWAQRFHAQVPIYIKADVSIDNNVLSFQLISAQLGRLNIPLGKISNDLKSKSTSNIQAENFNAQSVHLTPGQLEFIGTYPSVIYIK